MFLLQALSLSYAAFRHYFPGFSFRRFSLSYPLRHTFRLGGNCGNSPCVCFSFALCRSYEPCSHSLPPPAKTKRQISLLGLKLLPEWHPNKRRDTDQIPGLLDIPTISMQNVSKGFLLVSTADGFYNRVFCLCFCCCCWSFCRLDVCLFLCGVLSRIVQQ